MSIFAIADLHLSLNSGKPMDVFPGWENYLEKLERNWNASVCDDDTVVLPGDLSWAMSLEGAAEDFAYLDALPGRKIILKGNHDFWWTTVSKMEAFLSRQGYQTLSILHNSAVVAEGVALCGSRGWFYDNSCGADKKVLLREAGRLDTSISAAEKTGLEPVVFLHYPPVYGDFYSTEIMEVLLRHGIRRCFYGHLHGKAASSAVEGTVDGVSFRLVSADRLHFAPLKIEPAP